MVKSSNLSWIVVSDVKKAKKFFIEMVGLKESSFSEEYGWAELQGDDGKYTIGLAQTNEREALQPRG